MKKFKELRNLDYLVDCGILDSCCLRSPCPYSNMVCKSCPFSREYRNLFSRRNVFAGFEHEILKVYTSSTFVNRNVYISFNDKLTLRSFF